MRKLFLYIRTLRHLKPIQIYYKNYYTLKNKLFGLNYNILKTHSHQYPSWNHPTHHPFITNYTTYKPPHTFTFLNLTHTFHNKIDWNYSSHKKLWTYNLNYFDYLLQEEITKETGLQLIHQYIKDFTWIKDGKEPYPTSLRIINWIKFCLKHNIQDKTIVTALHNQAIHLSKNLEYHLLANHLLENAFALTIVAYYFGEEKLFKKASKLLLSQLKEQILPDGAHYERSPMYHQIILYRLLDTINMLTALQKKDLFEQNLHNDAGLMLGWLQQMTFSGNHLPLFKDAANGIAPSTEELTTYASSLNVKSHVKPLKESGYRKFSSDKYEILIDTGNISPSYQPGHAHADHLSYELFIGGLPVVIDTGTSTYNTSEIRSLERSTAAHNTVTIDNQNSSEVWASHRVGARVSVKLNTHTENSLTATMSFAQNKNIKHTRTVETEKQSIRIDDRIQNTNKIAISRIHIHPNRKLKLKENLVFIDATIQLEFQGQSGISIEPFYYAPEFNKRIESKVICISFKNKLVTRFQIL